MQNKFLRIIFPYFLLPTFYLLLALVPSPAHAGYLASDLLGQLDANDNPVFTTNSSNNGSSTTNNRGFVFPTGAMIDRANHRLFVADGSNNRVLVFNLDTQNNLLDRVADAVLGQSNFASSTATTTASNMNFPIALSYDSAQNLLFVADYGNLRVLVFDASSITNGQNAVNVLGQTNFTSSTATTTQIGGGQIRGIAYDSNNRRLFACDGSNNRVLVYDLSSGITNGMNASYVLGQPTFASSTATTTQQGMSLPSGATYDASSSRLFVADFSNNRVLVFDVATSTIANGENASYVLGQTSFTSSTGQATQAGLSNANGVAYDSVNKQLFVSVYNNHRIVIFNAGTSTISNGMNAFAVLGQNNFTSSSASTAADRLRNPGGLNYDPVDNRLYATDVNNHRILIFNFVSIPTATLPGGTTGDAYYQTINTSSSQGTVSVSVTSGTLPSGLFTEANRISGGPTAAGTYSFSLTATDTNSSIGYFLSQPQSFTITITTSSPRASVTIGNNNYVPAPQTPVVTPVVQPNLTYLPPSSIVLGTPGASSQNLIPAQVSVPSVSSLTFTQNLKVADKKSDVQSLQQYLNVNGFVLTQSGPGSPGNETNLFGSLTKQALIKFQEAHADAILKPAGLTKGTGYFGASTRAYVNAHN